MEENLVDTWEAYGFKGNPYDTRPLSPHKGSLLSVENAFIGRKNTEESELLMRLLGTSGGNRIVIEGEVGVGKTTLINYYRHFWEHKIKKERRLFTSFGEIPIYHNWQVKDFMFNIISHLIHKLVLVDGIKKVASEPLFEELLVLDKVYQQFSYQTQAQILGSGIGVGKNKQTTIPPITEARLQFYVQQAIEAICKRGYRGVIFHFDNLELLQTSQIGQIQQIFQNLRDLFQTPNTYFLFIGPVGFFRKIISPLERVRSIFFGWPVYVPPLTKEEVIEAIHRRYNLLAMEKLRWIQPVDDDCIAFLYDLYEGKIRFIMDTLQALFTRFPRCIGKTIALGEAQTLLTSFMEEKVLQLLTPREFEVLMKIATLKQITNSEIVKVTKLDKGNISKYLQKFMKLGFIKVVKKEGRNVFYTVNHEVKILQTMSLKKISLKKPLIKISPRQKKIIEYLRKRKFAATKEISNYLEISYPTTRKDLEKLTKQDLIFSRKEGRKFLYMLADH